MTASATPKNYTTLTDVTGLRRAGDPGDLDGTAVWFDLSRRLITGRSGGRGRAPVAKRHRRRHRCCRLQRLLLHVDTYDGLAGGGWHAGPCIKVGGACRAWV